jgi:hypothetical protein
VVFCKGWLPRALFVSLWQNERSRNSMTKRDMANLLLKASSIYAFLMALKYVPYFINDLSKLPQPEFPLVFQTSMPTLSMILAGIFLWAMSRRGARIIFGKDDIDNTTGASVADIQVIAFSLGGLYLVANAIPALVNQGVFYIWFLLKGSKTDDMASYLIFPFIDLCIGLWLLFGSKGIVVFVKKIRRAGQIRSFNSAARQ